MVNTYSVMAVKGRFPGHTYSLQWLPGAKDSHSLLSGHDAAAVSGPSDT